MKLRLKVEASLTPQEMERTMGFIIEQQAHFAVRIDKLLESVEKLERSDERLHETQATLTASLLRVVDIVGDLAEAQKRTEARLQQTDERLNVLINVVEKHITNPHQGGTPSQKL